MQDTAKEHFITTWQNGYYDNWAHSIPIADFVKLTIEPYYNPHHVALEVGCGRGFWTTQYLSGNFRKIICIDVIPKPDQIAALNDAEFIELPNRDFTCYGVANNSIDFVWSYGCFCHLTMAAVQEYLNNLFLKVKSGANLVIMFGNWERHPQLCKVDPSAEYRPELCPWFYQNIELVQNAVHNAGFINFQDLYPDCRDTIAYFKKA